LFALNGFQFANALRLIDPNRSRLFKISKSSRQLLRKKAGGGELSNRIVGFSARLFGRRIIPLAFRALAQ
jgi:hypothetical protein